MEVPTATSPVTASRHFPWVATVLFSLALIGVLVFAWRVFSFYRKIQAGELDPGTYGLTRATGSAEAALAALVANARGSGALATGDDPALGSPTAAVTIVEFGDFGCPYTRQESYVLRALATKFGSSIRYIYRDFPLEELHPGAERAAAAATCADNQGKFWEFHDALFTTDDIGETRILEVADEIGLNVDQFVTCVNDESALDEMGEDLADGIDAGVTGTPTFFVNGEIIEGAVPYDLFVNVIEAFLAKK